MAWYEANSLIVNTGAVESGAVSDTYTNNATRQVLDEVTGTPGFDYEYWFETMPGTVDWFRVEVDGYYDGNPAHIVEIKVWNFSTSTWYHFDTMNDAAADQSFISPDLESADYSSGGQVRVQFYHSSPGNTSHDLYLDMVKLVDRTVYHTTVAPTTPVPTTSLTTAVPSTTAVPTTTLTTPPPTTAVPIEGFPIPPSFPVDPVINISLSITGIVLSGCIDCGSIDFTLDVDGSVNTGVTIVCSPINFYLTLKTADVLVSIDKCNFVKWSKIGSVDFTIDESNIAGEMPLDWKGCVYHLRKLMNKVMAYGANGVSALIPSGINYGLDTIYRIGLKNKGAFAGTDRVHFFVDLLGQLWQVDEGIKKLDYSEYISGMGIVILSLDPEKNLLYICDGSVGYIYGIESGSFGEGPAGVSGFGVQSNTVYVVSNDIITTPVFQICTDIYDMGTRKPKTIHSIEVGTNVDQNLYASVDYRNSYSDDFKQIGWFLVNPNGKAFPKCYGVEFRFRLKSLIYEYFEVDYLKIRGHIHGFSYLDTQING